MINVDEVYASLRDKLSGTLKSALSVSGPKTLKVNKIWAADDLDQGDLDSQLRAKLEGRSWAIPVYGDISLVDPSTGKELDRSKKIRLMEIPKLTPRFSFIVGGEEFQVANQLRLKPGVYVKSKPNETTAHFKMPIGYSRFNHSIDYHPKDKKWTVELDGKTVPLYSHLNALGISDDEIVDTLGLEALDQMKAQADLKRDVAKIRTILTGEKAAPDALGENSQTVRDKLFALPMTPDVPKMKYGKEYGTFSKGLVLDALKNVKGVLSGDEEPDVDSSRFKEFRTFDDILSERIEKSVQGIQNRIKLRMRDKANVRDVVQPDKLDDIVTSFFNRSQLSNYPTQSNPVNFISGITRTTVFGEGSIGNKRAVTKEDRDIDPSMFASIDPMHTPEAGDIGAVMHVTVGAKKGKGTILTRLFDPKKNVFQDVPHTEVYDKKIAFPNEYRVEGGKRIPIDQSIKALHRGRVITITPEEVDYVVDRPSDLFDFSTNMVPFVNAMHGGRGLMAAKMYDQAVSVTEPEAPLVQSAASRERDPEKTFEKAVGHLTAIVSPVEGTVTEVSDKAILIREKSGKTRRVQIYKDFPLNSRSFITSTPKVSVGDKVQPAQVVADTNFTKDGTLAIGKNLRVAWVPYRGYNYEDGIVVSESAAKKLTSAHMYKVDHDPADDGLRGRDQFAAYFPGKFSGDQLSVLDGDGVVKVGQKLKTGDPVVLHLNRKNVTPEDVILGKISRNLVRPYADASQTWDEPFEGEVVHVEKLGGGKVRVLVKAQEPLQVGDKMVSRYAAKGLVTKIVPDAEMPQTKDGQPVEVLLNPMGLPTRMNPAQIYEALAGKIADKEKKPYIVDNFEPVDLREKIQKDLQKAGLTDTEELVDPQTGRSLGGITVGKQFMMKLEHAAKEKFNARDPGNAYTADLRPAKSGEGAQTIGHMELSALLSHGALANIRDMATYKAGKNDEFWRAIQANEPLPPPTQSFAFDKFVGLLKGAGINVERRGTQFQLKPLTDDQTEAMSAGAVHNSRMLLGKNLKPEEGGLFDETLTGGLTGKKWTHIDLPYELPNPVFEPSIRGVLGLTQKEFDDIMEERKHVDAFGKDLALEKGGETGAKAIRRMLGKVDVSRAIQALKAQAKTAKKSQLNSLNKAIRFLTNLKQNDISFGDLFISKVPVLPPVFRPVYPLPDGTLNVSDVNYLYRDLIALKNQVRDLSDQLPEDQLRKQRADLYQAVKAVAGVGESISSPHYRGILEVVTGEHPKGSYFQSRVLRKQQELSGRAAIVGDPTLGMDEVGIPADMAWVIFKPFIVQKLVSQGMSPLEAEGMVSKRAAVAQDALTRAMAERPVIVNRAPTLHKHGIIAMKPKLSTGKSVRLNQLVTSGMNADFDGDTVGVHVPVTSEAVREAFDMMPSANPLSTSEKVIVTPRHEAQVGLYRLTQEGKKTGKAYANEVDAVVAFHKGEISETDGIQIAGVKTTVGRILVNKVLPEKLRKPGLVLDKGETTKILDTLARENPKGLAPVVDALKDIGNEYAYLSGLTISLADLGVSKAEIDAVLKKHDQAAREVLQSERNRKEADRKIVAIYSQAYDELKKKVDQTLREKRSSLGQMVSSGGRGDIAQATQIVAAPLLVEDVRGRVHPYAVRTGYAHGMAPADFWTSNYGSRRGAVETKLSTAEPGALTKSMVQTSLENRIVPGTAPQDERGLMFSVDDRESLGRFLTVDTPGLGKRGELFDSQMRERARAKGLKSVELGSPLTSTHPVGTYLLSYGVDERGKTPRPGAFIGITASQAIGEPMTQLILGSKHVQGITGKGAGAMTGFEKLKTLLTMPEDLPTKALISKEEGEVEKVDKVPGGYDIRVSGKNYFTPFEPVVKSGKKVVPGMALSKGLVDPRDLLETQGIDKTRRYMVDEIYDIFNGNVRKKHIETVVRSVTDTALVTDPGGRQNLVEGDVVPLNVVRAENRKNAAPVPINLARNAMLMEEIENLGGVEKILTDEDIEKLKRMGKTKVMATPNPVHFKPVLKGVDLVPLTRKDWMSALSFRRLKDVVQKGVAEGWKSDVAGWNPIPGIAYGASFGESPKEEVAKSKA